MESKLFSNLIELTHILNDTYECDLYFRILDNKIELEIHSRNTCNTYCFNVNYDFKVNDVICEFKDMVFNDSLKLTYRYE